MKKKRDAQGPLFFGLFVVDTNHFAISWIVFFCFRSFFLLIHNIFWQKRVESRNPTFLLLYTARRMKR